jgi:hypothetical protein
MLAPVMVWWGRGANGPRATISIASIREPHATTSTLLHDVERRGHQIYRSLRISLVGQSIKLYAAMGIDMQTE